MCLIYQFILHTRDKHNRTNNLRNIPYFLNIQHFDIQILLRLNPLFKIISHLIGQTRNAEQPTRLRLDHILEIQIRTVHYQPIQIILLSRIHQRRRCTHTPAQHH